MRQKWGDKKLHARILAADASLIVLFPAVLSVAPSAALPRGTAGLSLALPLSPRWLRKIELAGAALFRSRDWSN